MHTTNVILLRIFRKLFLTRWSRPEKNQQSSVGDILFLFDWSTIKGYEGEKLGDLIINIRNTLDSIVCESLQNVFQMAKDKHREILKSAVKTVIVKNIPYKEMPSVVLDTDKLLTISISLEPMNWDPNYEGWYNHSSDFLNEQVKKAMLGAPVPAVARTNLAGGMVNKQLEPIKKEIETKLNPSIKTYSAEISKLVGKTINLTVDWSFVDSPAFQKAIPDGVAVVTEVSKLFIQLQKDLEQDIKENSGLKAALQKYDTIKINVDVNNKVNDDLLHTQLPFSSYVTVTAARSTLTATFNIDNVIEKRTLYPYLARRIQLVLTPAYITPLLNQISNALTNKIVAGDEAEKLLLKEKGLRCTHCNGSGGIAKICKNCGGIGFMGKQ